EDLRGPILLGALALLALDALVVFLLAGGIGQLVRRRRPAVSALAIAILAAALLASPQAFAQRSDEQALRSTLAPLIPSLTTRHTRHHRGTLVSPPHERRGSRPPPGPPLTPPLVSGASRSGSIPRATSLPSIR